MTQEDAEKITAQFFENLEKAIVSKYHRNLASVQNMICALQNKTIGSLGKKVCHIDHGALHDAYAEMKNDINFLVKRRKELMTSLKPSFGKIAGIMAYRLAKNHIIHLCEGCASCTKPCAAKKLNQIFALRCAWEYIGIQYHRVPEDIRRELFYSFSCRHVNQETLGLVFDTIYSAYKNPPKTTP
jgi:hypothetical protein